MKKGSLSINSENIFPVIKKWLYSDHDIFVRELISNGCDAVTKLKKLSLMGEFDEPDEPYRIDVIASPDNKTLQFIDNGIGMTAEEVEKYINQIAFSGAAAFLEQYKDKATEEQIIGHFGLGFYSAFMVADKVTIESLSYKQDAEPVYWECENGTDFSMDKGDKETRGTVITLYLNEDSYEFANEYRIKEVIDKYCSFMPVEIYFTNADAPAKDEEEKATEAEASEEATAETDETKDAAEKKEKEARAAKENAAVDKAIENAQMEIPDAMLNTQVRQMLDDFSRRMQSQGLTMEQYFQFTGMTLEKMQEEMKPQALKRIQTRLVLEKIAEVENIQPTDEEVEEEFKKMADAYKMEVEKIKELLGDRELEQMKKDMAVQKAVTLVADEAKEA